MLTLGEMVAAHARLRPRSLGARDLANALLGLGLPRGGRVVGTVLRHSDYAGMARALGLHGERVDDPADLAGALRRALDNAPALIDVVTSQAAVSSDARKGLGFAPDYQPLTAWDDAERRRRGLL
jgi:acetolactate synthase-1/2/3 large subunit